MSHLKNKPLGASLGWRTTSARHIFECPWYRIRQDKVALATREITYTYLDHPGAVFIVPVTREKKIVVIRTYRYTIDEWRWEIPSGGIGDKQGRSLEEAAREEMFEEAGCSGGTLESLGIFYTANGAADLKAHYFIARDVDVAEKKPEDSELIERIELWSVDEAERAAREGKINDGESALAILLASAKLRA